MKHYFKDLFNSLAAIHRAELARGVWFRSK